MIYTDALFVVLAAGIGLAGNSLCDDSLQCGVRSGSSQKIVGGKVSTAPWPWMAGLIRKGTGRKSFCAATIISQKYALTAAHCLYATAKDDQIPTADLELAVGNMDISKAKRQKVKRAIVHPKYNKNMNYFDLALLELKKPLKLDGKNVNTVCLPAKNTIDYSKTGQKATIVGWGSLKQGRHSVSKLHEATIHLVSLKRCSKDYKKASKAVKAGIPQGVNGNFTCGGGYMHMDTCQGDSGGPLLVSKDGKYFQAGVVAFGMGCGKMNFPGVYTNLQSLLDFVTDHVAELRLPGHSNDQVTDDEAADAPIPVE